jgi:hypothetical protein
MHRDQFDSDRIEKREFFKQLQKANADTASMIRDFKEEHPKDSRNIMVVNLYALYADNCAVIQEFVTPNIFVSGWLPVEPIKTSTFLKDLEESFDKKPFCLGSAYQQYPLFNMHSKILAMRRKAGHQFLSADIQAELDKNPQNQNQYAGSFIDNLTQDFWIRRVNFDTPREDQAVFDHQTCSHTEQAFFSYIARSEECDFGVFPQGNIVNVSIPKSILVNMISYEPICSNGHCLKSINTLLSTDRKYTFKSEFLKKVLPSAYEASQVKKDRWEEIVSRVNLNLLYTASELPPIDSFGY